MMTTPHDVLRLIDQFAQQAAYYHSPRYNETQARREFIDPLFEQLGWDVANRNGQGPDAREVIHEDTVRVRATNTLPALPLLDLLNAGATEPTPDPTPTMRDGGRKAPDYSFRIGRTRKFFLEAKKPGVNIKSNADTAFQLRRYGWSASLPLSILTDFEEWAIYDCRVEPHQKDKADRARLDYFTYDQLPNKWDWLFNTFGRDAVRNGSFDQYVEAKKTTKGIVPVDKAFLKAIESWRDLLARDLGWRNQQLGTRELNAVVQMTLDRIIFLRICEDRGIEPYGQLLALTNGPHLYSRLGQVFQQADARYNSGLFHFRTERGRDGVPDDWQLNLSVGDDELRTVIKRLYFPDSPYVFNQIPADILGQVYEQFLGKVIRLESDHRAVVEDKPEVKKAGGVYYTPTYIVEYIVEQTVGKLLAGKTLQQVRGTAKNATPLRILDPACGSGSFLIGAYQYMLDWYRPWYTANDPHKHKDAVYQSESGAWWLTLQERKRILLDHIFGVDIDTQAVEVTKLSLLLKVLEGETEETLGSYRRLVQQRALPSLEHNIKCGNSLIGSDFYAQQALPDMDEQLRVNVFDWDGPDGFPTIMHAGGFDAVIGNPPYIRIQRIGHKEADYLFSAYKTPASKTDLSLLFIEKALSLTSETGLIGFICTSQWMATDYGKKMRQLLAKGHLHSIVNFGSLPVFENADTYPAIFILSPAHVSELHVKPITEVSQLNLTAVRNAIEVNVRYETLSELPWNLSGIDVTSALNRHGTPWKPLKIYGKAYYSIVTGMDAAFVLSKQEAEKSSLEDELVFPFAYRGTEVERYKAIYPNARVIYPYKAGAQGSPQLIPEGELKTKYPNIFRHLASYKNELQNRMDSRKYYAQGDNWYCHVRPGSFSHINQKKLLVKGIDTKSSVGLLAEGNAFSGANCPGIILESIDNCSLLYILGLLNSRVISYHLRMVCPAKLGGYTRFNAGNISDTPIRTIDFANPADRQRHDDMVRLVERMLELHKQRTAAKTAQERTVIERQIAATDREIDRLVYALYDLTADEIAIVEAATR